MVQWFCLISRLIEYLGSHLVGAEKTWCGGVDCATGAGDVSKCMEPCPCWWGVQWRVWSEGWCSPRISTQPTALHHCAWSLIMRVPLWGPLGGPLCRWPCYHHWIAWGICQEALDLERVLSSPLLLSSWSAVQDWTSCRGEFPCAVCCTGVGSNSIFCNGCKHWVHKKCSGLKHLKKDPDFRCTQCQGTARPLDGIPQKEVQVGPDKLEVVASFCYLEDMLSAAGGCELSTTTCVKTAWNKFKDLLPVLSSRHLSFKTHGHVYSSCVRSAMLHASETWPLTKPNLQHLQRNDRAMIRQICNVRPQDIVTTRSNELLVRLGIEDLDLILKERRLRWYGHVERSSGAIKTAFDIQVDGKRGSGRPKMTWKQLRGIAESGNSRLSTLMIDVPGDLVWDLPCVQQASYLEGGPLMWMLPLYLHVNQKSDYDDMISQTLFDGLSSYLEYLIVMTQLVT